MTATTTPTERLARLHAWLTKYDLLGDATAEIVNYGREIAVTLSGADSPVVRVKAVGSLGVNIIRIRDGQEFLAGIPDWDMTGGTGAVAIVIDQVREARGDHFYYNDCGRKVYPKRRAR